MSPALSRCCHAERVLFFICFCFDPGLTDLPLDHRTLRDPPGPSSESFRYAEDLQLTETFLYWLLMGPGPGNTAVFVMGVTGTTHSDRPHLKLVSKLVSSPHLFSFTLWDLSCFLFCF